MVRRPVAALADYSGVDFWFNAGNYPQARTNVVVIDAANVRHSIRMEDVYGGPLTPNLWINFQISFSSPLFTLQFGPPLTLKTLCFINHSDRSASPEAFVHFDDVQLIGATPLPIFDNGFE